MKVFFNTVALWVALVAFCYLLTIWSPSQVEEVLAFSFRFILPITAVWLTGRAASTIRRPWVRAFFWAPTLVAWFAAALLVQTRYETTAQDGKAMLIITGICALVIPARVALRTKMYPTWRGLRDAFAGAALAAVAAGIFVGIYASETNAIARNAEARWAELGLPLDTFEKSLVATHENSGSEISRQIFHEYLGQPFYRNGSIAAKREQPIPQSADLEKLEGDYVSVIGVNQTPSDVLDLSSYPMPTLKARSAELAKACERILQAEPPSWQTFPADDWSAAPGFLALRKFSQLATAQANRQIADGDIAGATRTLAAGQRVYTQLKDSPTFVSLMMRTVLDSLFATVEVRLPAREDGLSTLAHDAVELRADFVRGLQSESVMALRQARKFTPDEFTASSGLGLLPPWARRMVESQYIPRQFANTALNNAEHAAICRAPETLSLPDLGFARHEAVAARNQRITDCSISRAAMRLEATLLLREQAELLRITRAKLSAHQSVESHDSVILPGLRWEIAANPGNRTASLKLLSAPKWVIQGKVTAPQFWILPLDGSVAWQFRTAPLSALLN